MVDGQLLVVEEEIKDCSEEGLDTPNCSDNSNVDVGQMSEVHCQNYTGLSSNVNAHSHTKCEKSQWKKFAIYNDILRIPATPIFWILSLVPESIDNGKDNSNKHSTWGSIENTRQCL